LRANSGYKYSCQSWYSSNKPWWWRQRQSPKHWVWTPCLDGCPRGFNSIQSSWKLWNLYTINCCINGNQWLIVLWVLAYAVPYLISLCSVFCFILRLNDLFFICTFIVIIFLTFLLEISYVTLDALCGIVLILPVDGFKIQTCWLY
jgi:hypothetical protein